MAQTKTERFFVSTARSVIVKNHLKENVPEWEDVYANDIRELIERAGFDPDSAVEEDFGTDTLTSYFLTDEYRLVYIGDFRGYVIPEGSVFRVGRDFANQARVNFNCDLFTPGDEIKIVVVVFNDENHSVDYYLRAFEVLEKELEIELSEESLVDPEALKAGGYYDDDKLISASKQGEEIPTSVLDDELDALYVR